MKNKQFLSHFCSGFVVSNHFRLILDTVWFFYWTSLKTFWMIFCHFGHFESLWAYKRIILDKDLVILGKFWIILDRLWVILDAFVLFLTFFVSFWKDFDIWNKFKIIFAHIVFLLHLFYGFQDFLKDCHFAQILNLDQDNLGRLSAF